MRRLLVFLVLAGCARAVAPPSPAPARPPPPAGHASVTASPPPATPAVCLAPTTVDTIDDGGGVPDATGSTDLEDVQILADDDTIAVAWARQSNFLYGDSWRSPHLAIRSKADPSWRQVELPTLATPARSTAPPRPTPWRGPSSRGAS